MFFLKIETYALSYECPSWYDLTYNTLWAVTCVLIETTDEITDTGIWATVGWWDTSTDYNTRGLVLNNWLWTAALNTYFAVGNYGP